MANETILKSAAAVNLGAVESSGVSRVATQLINAGNPAIFPRLPRPPLPTPVHPAPAPPTPTPAPPTPAPPPALPPPAPAVPAPPASSPFANLPFPSPGDRIKADDFKALSQSLNILYDMVVLSSSLFGVTFAEAKAALGGQRYSIQRVMTVFGNEITSLTDTSLDSRKVIQVIPAAPGDPRVLVVVTEAVDTRRFAPNLVGLTYRDAASRIQQLLADVTITGAPPSAPQLTGLTLATVEQTFNK
jgi:hypothetical protein